MTKEPTKTQVEKEHYFNDGYDNIFRFLSYFKQIELIKKQKPKSILEIGVGNGLVSTYLKQNNYQIKTMDFDKKLKPDILGDIRKIPLKNNSMDVVVAFEVLEHLPFEEFEKTILEMKRVTKKTIIISLPYPCINFCFALKIPLINLIIKKPIPTIMIRIPKFWQKHTFDGEHYWELGKKDYSIKKIKNILKKYFKSVKTTPPLMNPYHEFFILKKH